MLIPCVWLSFPGGLAPAPRALWNSCSLTSVRRLHGSPYFAAEFSRAFKCLENCLNVGVYFPASDQNYPANRYFRVVEFETRSLSTLWLRFFCFNETGRGYVSQWKSRFCLRLWFRWMRIRKNRRAQYVDAIKRKKQNRECRYRKDNGASEKIAKQRHCFEENVSFYSKHIPLVAIQRSTRPTDAPNDRCASFCVVFSRKFVAAFRMSWTPSQRLPFVVIRSRRDEK